MLLVTNITENLEREKERERGGQSELQAVPISLTSIKFLGPIDRFLALATSCMEGLLDGVLPDGLLLTGEPSNLGREGLNFIAIFLLFL